MEDLACIPCNVDTPEAKVKLLVAQQEEKLDLLLKIRLEEEKRIDAKSKSLPPTVPPSASHSSRSLDSAPSASSGPGFVAKTLAACGGWSIIKPTHQQEWKYDKACIYYFISGPSGEQHVGWVGINMDTVDTLPTDLETLEGVAEEWQRDPLWLGMWVNYNRLGFNT